MARRWLYGWLAFCPGWTGRRSLPPGEPVLSRSNTEEPYLCGAICRATGIYRAWIFASDESDGRRSRSAEWARWVIFLALGGFFGNFVLSLTDHASNGFFAKTEWIPVISSALATGFLIVPLVLTVTRRFMDVCLIVMLTQALVGVLGILVSRPGKSC